MYVTVHFWISGCGKVAPAPTMVADAVGCHPAIEDKVIMVADVMVSDVIIDSWVVAIMAEELDDVIDEASDIIVETWSMLVLELLLDMK